MIQPQISMFREGLRPHYGTFTPMAAAEKHTVTSIASTGAFCIHNTHDRQCTAGETTGIIAEGAPTHSADHNTLASTIRGA